MSGGHFHGNRKHRVCDDFVSEPYRDEPLRGPDLYRPNGKPKHGWAQPPLIVGPQSCNARRHEGSEDESDSLQAGS